MAWNAIEQVITPLSGNQYIDSLLDQGHITYNFELPYKGYINYTFDIASIKSQPTGNSISPMTDDQKQGVRNALAYISSSTGIPFKEQPSSSDDFVFANVSNYKDGRVAEDSYSQQVSLTNGVVTGLTLFDTITLNANKADSFNLTPGTEGYASVLHEIGHALGFKHPYEEAIAVPQSMITGTNTVMGPEGVTPIPSTFGLMDVAAMRWLYGGDGLLGQYGLTVNASGTPVQVQAPNLNETLAGLSAISGTITEGPETGAQTVSWTTASLSSSDIAGATLTGGAYAVYTGAESLATDQQKPPFALGACS